MGKEEDMKEVFQLNEISVKDATKHLLGFKQEWITAEDGDKRFELLSGAGCGNPYLEFTYKKDKDTLQVRYAIDMRDLFRSLVDKVLTINEKHENADEKTDASGN